MPGPAARLVWFVGLGIDDTVLVPGVFGTDRDRLLTTDMSRRVIVEMDVHESDAAQVRTGLPAAVQLSGEDDVQAGHVSFVSQQAKFHAKARTGGPQ